MIRLAILTLVAGVALVAPATSSYAAACSGSTGVTVVVDFASLGGGTQSRCAPGDPATAVEAMRGAGFSPTRAAQQPGYFVCRIDGKPASDPCQRASPADAYWSYWHGAPGGSWTFSNAGAAEYDPAPGSVEGWAFGAGDPPSSPPPARAKPSPSPVPRASTAPPATQAATAPSARSDPSPSTKPTAVPTVRATAMAVAARTLSPAATTAPSPEPSVEPVRVAAPVDDDPGAPTGPLAAAAVLAVLAALGLAQARRRR